MNWSPKFDGIKITQFSHLVVILKSGLSLLLPLKHKDIFFGSFYLICMHLIVTPFEYRFPIYLEPTFVYGMRLGSRSIFIHLERKFT